MIAAAGRVSDPTNLGEYVIYPNQHRVFLKGMKMLISGNVPLATNTPGDGYRSRTNGGSYCTHSQAKVFIEGEAMAHNNTKLDSDPGHYINKPGYPRDEQCYVAYKD